MGAVGARSYRVRLHVVLSEHSLLVSGLILVSIVEVTVSEMTFFLYSVLRSL